MAYDGCCIDEFFKVSLTEILRDAVYLVCWLNMTWSIGDLAPIYRSIFSPCKLPRLIILTLDTYVVT